jgi:exopolyphosphatase/guanosine-5'-triphosphate,3'-diphosphate pyrophosphatase
VKNKTLAAIDIGTNTFRLLIAEVGFDPQQENYTIREIHSERVITRLGEGIHESRNLKDEAVERSITALKKFCRTVGFHDVDKISALATSALREAENSDYFLEEVKKVTELPITVISGEEEAKITSTGILLDMDVPDRAFMIDIGGGSTELVYAKRGAAEYVHSLNTGVVYLAGKYMLTDPPSPEALKQMEQEIVQKITATVTQFQKLMSEETVFIGTAGTVTSLAAMAQNLTTFEHDKIHNYTLSFDMVKNLFSTISTISSEDRARLIPFELARLDIIVPGTLILLKLMEAFGFKEITVSNYGLREGILIDLYNKLRQQKDT